MPEPLISFISLQFCLQQAQSVPCLKNPLKHQATEWNSWVLTPACKRVSVVCLLIISFQVSFIINYVPLLMILSFHKSREIALPRWSHLVFTTIVCGLKYRFFSFYRWGRLLRISALPKAMWQSQDLSLQPMPFVPQLWDHRTLGLML